MNANEFKQQLVVLGIKCRECETSISPESLAIKAELIKKYHKISKWPFHNTGQTLTIITDTIQIDIGFDVGINKSLFEWTITTENGTKCCCKPHFCKTSEIQSKCDEILAEIKCRDETLIYSHSLD